MKNVRLLALFITLTLASILALQTALFAQIPGRTFPLKPGAKTLAPSTAGESVSAAINDGSYDAFGIMGRFPSGKLIIVYRKGKTHAADAGIIVYRTSTDNGKYWSPTTTIRAETRVDLRNVGGGVTPSGRLVVSWLRRDFSRGVAKTDPSMQYVYSDNEAATFSSPATLGGTSYSPYGKLIAAANDKLIMPLYQSNRSAFTTSTDNGTNWDASPTTIYSSSGENPSETSIVYLDDQTLIAVIRRQSIGTWAQFISTNNGVSWTSQSSIGYVSHAPTPAWLETYIGPSGRRIVALYYYSRTDGAMRVNYAYAADVITGPSAWVSANVRTFATGSTAGGYPACAQDSRSANAICWWFDEKPNVINFLRAPLNNEPVLSKRGTDEPGQTEITITTGRAPP